jgi:hypothetical protein
MKRKVVRKANPKQDVPQQYWSHEYKFKVPLPKTCKIYQSTYLHQVLIFINSVKQDDI